MLAPGLSKLVISHDLMSHKLPLFFGPLLAEGTELPLKTGPAGATTTPLMRKASSSKFGNTCPSATCSWMNARALALVPGT